MRLHSPATIFLQRAQLVFMLAVLIPTVLMTAIGILLVVARGSHAMALVGGILVLAFCATAFSGWMLGTSFVNRGANLATVQNGFLSAVSHELRTPLTSIRMFIDTLREGRVTDATERARCLTIVHQELIRLDGLVTRLMALSKIESGHNVFERKAVEVDDVIQDAVKAFDALQVNGAVDLRVKIAPRLRVLGDRTALAQAVGNLLANAWKYGAAEGPWIELVANGDQRQIFISVTDNGPGIPRDEQQVIFDKFVRGSTAQGQRDAGTGLGLALVRAIVDAHKGKVDVRSEPKAGASFRITLPRLVPDKAS